MAEFWLGFGAYKVIKSLTEDKKLPNERLYNERFYNCNISSCELKTGIFVDSVSFNGLKYGGNGGNARKKNWCSNVYIKKIEWREGAIIDKIKITFSDGTIISGGGNGGQRNECVYFKKHDTIKFEIWRWDGFIVLGRISKE